MSIILQLSVGTAKKFGKDVVSIGREASCDLSMSQDQRLHARHAVIHKVAGRWLIESAGDWLIRVGAGLAGRKCWLKPGDVIHLTEIGPDVTFDVVASDGVSHSSEVAAQGRRDTAPTQNVEAAPPPPPLPRESLVAQEVRSPEPGPPALAAGADETPPPLPATPATPAPSLASGDTLLEQKPFPEYAWQYYRATHGLTTWTVAVVVGMLSVPVLSFLKPVLGFRTLVAIPAILAVILAVSATAFMLARIIGYYLQQRRDAPHDARSWLSIIAYGSMVMLVPLTLLVIVEFFTPPHGGLVALAPSLRPEQDSCGEYLKSLGQRMPLGSRQRSQTGTGDHIARDDSLLHEEATDYTYDYSKDDYTTIPTGATRETRLEPNPSGGSEWLEREGYIAANGEFVEHGKATLWSNKQRITKVHCAMFLHGKLHGPWNFYYEDGSDRTEEFYVHGRIHGVARRWYENGDLESERHYLNGGAHGSFRFWHRNRIVKEECAFVKNRRVGPFTIRDDDGFEIVSGRYESGQMVGTWKFGFQSISGRKYTCEVEGGPWTGGTRAEFCARVRYEAQKNPDHIFGFDPQRGVATHIASSEAEFVAVFGPPDRDEPDFYYSSASWDDCRMWTYSCTDGQLTFKKQPTQDGGIMVACK